MAIKMDDSENQEIMAEINMTPLIDIMLVLLIIFMVTSSVSLESGLDIDLPKTHSSTTKKEGQAVLISLDAQGVVMVQGASVKREELKEKVRGALEESKTTLVVFEGDQKANIGAMVEIMDLARDAGATQFAVAAEGKGN